VTPGTAVFVPAGVEHHFHSITAELQVLVIFAPAETPATS
jgi:mannose-6-phosphate isomerase-like protein (cupin superfamily)